MTQLQAGNWQRFESFAWHDKPKNPEQWAIVHTHTRDADLLEQSNAAAIAERMAPHVESGEAREEHSGHWAIGWVDGYAIRVETDGQRTAAAKEWDAIQEQLADYPVLNEEDLGEREYEASLESVKEWGAWCANERAESADGWIGDVMVALTDANALQDEDGWFGEEDIHKVMRELGYLDLESSAA